MGVRVTTESSHLLLSDHELVADAAKDLRDSNLAKRSHKTKNSGGKDTR